MVRLSPVQSTLAMYIAAAPRPHWIRGTILYRNLNRPFCCVGMPRTSNRIDMRRRSWRVWTVRQQSGLWSWNSAPTHYKHFLKMTTLNKQTIPCNSLSISAFT